MLCTKKRYFSLIFILLASIYSQAQHQLGMRLETRAGIHSIAINPSSILSNQSKWEIHLVGAGIFFENDYFFLKKASLGSLYRHRNNLSIVFEQTPDSPNIFELDFGQGNQNRFLNANAYVDGPSIAFKPDENQSIAIFTRMRSVTGVNTLPGDYSYFAITRRPFNQPFQIDKYKGGLVNWLEIGVNYAKTLQINDQYLDVGLSLKYLRGYDMIYLKSNRTYDHSVINTNDFTMTGPDFSFAYTPLQNMLSASSGSGASIDLGFNYTISSDKEGYLLKIGASLMDIGTLSFKENVTQLRYVGDGTLTIRGDDFANVDISNGLDGVTNLFIDTVIANRPSLTRASSSMVFTPASLILNADYKVMKKAYVNGLYVQSLQAFGPGTVNGNMLAITPRWEEKWWSASLPISLYQWQKLRVGLAARLGYVTLGSDKISSFLYKDDLSGMDFYTSIKIPFGAFNPRMRMGKRVKGSVECYPM